MSDPTELLEGIAAAEDAFGHAHGRPTFEPELNATADRRWRSPDTESLPTP